MTIAALVAKAPVRRSARDAKDDLSGVVRQIQKALVRAGAELLIDGEYGSATEAAVIAFKARHGLAATGLVGPLTGDLLDKVLATAEPTPEPLPSVKAVAPWLMVARAITGTKEFPGGRDNPIIFEWRNYIVERFPELGPGVRWYNHDSIAWCGLGQAYCFSKAGYRPPLYPLGALNWAGWPDGRHLSEPSLGALGVMHRVGGGHVTEYEGENDTHWFGRGCNQSDAVNVMLIPKSREVTWMWPKAAPPPTGGRVRTSFANAVKSASEA